MGNSSGEYQTHDETYWVFARQAGLYRGASMARSPAFAFLAGKPQGGQTPQGRQGRFASLVGTGPACARKDRPPSAGGLAPLLRDQHRTHELVVLVIENVAVLDVAWSVGGIEREGWPLPTPPWSLPGAPRSHSRYDRSRPSREPSFLSLRACRATSCC